MERKIINRVTLERQADGSLRAVESAANPTAQSTSVEPTPAKSQGFFGRFKSAQPAAQPNPAVVQPKVQPVPPITDTFIAPTPSPVVQTVQPPRPVATLPQTPQIAPAPTTTTPPVAPLPSKIEQPRKLPTLTMPPKKALIASVAVVALVVGSAVAVFAINTRGGVKIPANGAKAAASVSKTPQFKTVVPDGDVSKTDSKTVGYDSSKQVASYIDTLSGVPITVSMQAMPSSFPTDASNQVQKIAENFSANTELPVDKYSAFLGTSAKGPQSLVGYKGRVLIFITSDTKIDNSAWVQYFDSLK